MKHRFYFTAEWDESVLSSAVSLPSAIADTVPAALTAGSQSATATNRERQNASGYQTGWERASRDGP